MRDETPGRSSARRAPRGRWTLLHVFAVLLVALPALGIAGHAAADVMQEWAGLEVNGVFHSLLAFAEIALAVEVCVAILHARAASRVFVLGGVGAVLAVAVGFGSEVFGPPALMAFGAFLVLAACAQLLRPARGVVRAENDER